VALTHSEASALAAALWRIGERQNARGAIALSVALLDAKRNRIPVAVDSTQLDALREALGRAGGADAYPGLTELAKHVE
jgi:hypothetical protein